MLAAAELQASLPEQGVIRKFRRRKIFQQRAERINGLLLIADALVGAAEAIKDFRRIGAFREFIQQIAIIADGFCRFFQRDKTLPQTVVGAFN